MLPYRCLPWLGLLALLTGCGDPRQEAARLCLQKTIDEGGISFGDGGKARVVGVQILSSEEVSGQLRLRVTAEINARELVEYRNQPRELIVYLEKTGEQLRCSGANWR
jgi:hypothetical protein